MTADSIDYYETLEVPATATPEQLKSAYLRLVREFTPESAPERFRLVSEAYRTLSNPDKRREYDSQERLPDEVLRRMSELMARIVEEEDQTAVDLLRELCDEHPESKDLRFGLGIALDRIERNDEAARVFGELFEVDPASSIYATWLGDSLLKSGLQAPGVQKLKEAIVLDKDCSDAYLCLSRHYATNDKDAEALKILERGIYADGTVDVQDLPLFIERILILAKTSSWTELEKTATRLLTALPSSDVEARCYAASQLGPMVPMFYEAGRPDLTHFTLDLMRQLDPENPKFKEGADELESEASFYRGREKLYKDAQVPDWIKALVACWSGDQEPDDREEFGTTIMELLFSRPGDSLSEWEQHRRRHPKALDPLAERWNEISGPMKPMASEAKSRNRVSSQPAQSGKTLCHCGSGRRFENCHGLVKSSTPSTSASGGGDGCLVLLFLGGTAFLVAGGLL